MSDSLFPTTAQAKEKLVHAPYSLNLFLTDTSRLLRLRGKKGRNPVPDPKQVAGFYKSSRRFESSFLDITTPLGEPKVIANADGTINVEPLKNANDQLKKFEEIGPFLYREVHGQDQIAFKKDADGNWQFQLDYPFFIFQKVGLLPN